MNRTLKRLQPLIALAAIALGVWALAVQPAPAETLRPRVVVNDEVIHLGDLFASLPAAVADRAVAPAPAPGASVVFDAASLAVVARDNRLAWAPQTRFDRVLVQRASRVVTAEDVELAIRAALKADGLEPGLRIEVLNRRMTLNAATGDRPPFEVQAVQYDRRDGSFTATLALNAGGESTTPVEVRGNVFRSAKVPVLARAMRHGQVIADTDVTWIDVRAGAVDPSVVNDPGSLIGKTPRSAVRAGEMLRQADLVAPIVIAKGELVTMVLTTSSMALTATGRAVENGSDGQSIKVQNTRSKVTVEGVVAGPNRVVITSPTLALR